MEEATEQANKSTKPRWWTAGPPYLLTRDELLDELHKRGLYISERQIRSWVSYGLLPKPIRRVPSGATDGVARALYPLWIIGVIGELYFSTHNVQPKKTLQWLKKHTQKRIQRWEGQDASFIPTTPRDQGKSAELEEAVIRAIRAYAEHFAQGMGRPIVQATAEILFANGSRITLDARPSAEKSDD
jgi:hypothetical protein